MSGLVASSDGISLQQATTFKGEIHGLWAIVYDLAEPPGCSAGGLWGAPDGPAVPEKPCKAFVLMRRKSRWTVLSSGIPGSFVPPEEAPKALGDTDNLAYMGD